MRILSQIDAFIRLLLGWVVSLLPMRIRLKPRPGVVVDPNSGLWRWTDEDPWIHFRPPLLVAYPPGLYEVTFTGIRSTADLAEPKLYYNRGRGFTEQDTVDLAALRTAADVHRIRLRLPAAASRIRFDPSTRPGAMGIETVRMRRITGAETVARALDRLRRRHPMTPRALLGYLKLARDTARARGWVRLGRIIVSALTQDQDDRASDYGHWARVHDTPGPADLARLRAAGLRLPERPLLSVVVPTYNTPIKLLKAMIESVQAQTYARFELCIADDASPDPAVVRTIRAYQAADDRIRLVVRPENGHISRATNAAIEIATGDWIVLLDHDDELPPHALHTVAAAINRHPGAKVIFSDEDKITEAGQRLDPYFKGSFDPYLFYGHNMVSHLGVYRRDLVEAVGGFRPGYEGSQDYDLALRILELCRDDEVIHIPHVLYHWRMTIGSTALGAGQKSYAIDAARRAIDDHFQRTGAPYRSLPGRAPGISRIGVDPARIKPGQSISLVIPTRDGHDLLAACLGSLEADLDRGTIHEIIVVDHQSTEPETLRLLDEMRARHPAFRVVRFDEPFNFSRMNNRAAAVATGTILGFLNNDTEMVSTDWAERVRAHFSVPSIGAVGARLLYPDHTLQHFGIHVGAGEHKVAVHAHHGLREAEAGNMSRSWLTQQFAAVTAACLFVDKALYTAIGGFDEAFPVAYNDVDLCLKVRAAGRKIICDADLVLIHKESKTRGSDMSAEKRSRLDRDAAAMHAKWGATLLDDPFTNPNLDTFGRGIRLAYPPRVAAPWATDEPAAVAQGLQRAALI